MSRARWFGTSTLRVSAEPVPLVNINLGLVHTVRGVPHELDVEPALPSRKDWGLSRPNLNLDQANLRWARGVRRFEVELKSFLQVRQSHFFGFALPGDVNFQALRDVPWPFLPDGCREWSLQATILSPR